MTINLWFNRPEEEVETKKKKHKPSFKPSGLLAKDQRVVEKGIETKFVLPPEARKPEEKWVLVPFKQGEPLDPYYIYKQSHYLLGRDRDICNIPLDHPSCSKQHAAIVFRQNIEEDELGRKTSIIKPYIMDLGSTNGTFINDVKIDDMRYIELFEKDAIKFGASSREYIIIIDKTDDSWFSIFRYKLKPFLVWNLIFNNCIINIWYRQAFCQLFAWYCIF